MRTWFNLTMLGVGSWLIMVGETDACKSAHRSAQWITTRSGPAFEQLESREQSATVTPSGLAYIDQKEGRGARAKAGDHVVVHYTGRLRDGKQFDTSLSRDTPFMFQLGKGQVIKGWDEGVAGMKIGGKRKLIIPPDLAYGNRGVGAVIPPDSELHFDVEVIDIK
jgi:FKBP-type peptidyl-prolyl cis-trans isomerase